MTESFDVPPEVIERYRMDQKAKQIETDEFTHGVLGFVDSLTRDQLEGLTAMIVGVSVGGAGPYWLGFIASRLDTEYDICPLCHVAHAPLEEAEPYVQEETLFDVT